MRRSTPRSAPAAAGWWCSGCMAERRAGAEAPETTAVRFAARQPSAKGTLVLGVVVAARRLREKGKISPEQLEARLSKAALELIEQKINIAGWYPIQVFTELMDLSWELSGSREPDFMRRE